MAESRKKNVMRNMMYGMLNKSVFFVLPFITRTITIYYLGSEYLGIGTLFSSILSFLSISELGLGSAIVYMMYKPIADNDIPQINALLNYYRKLYRCIGAIMLLIGTCLIPAVPFLIKGDAPKDVNIYILYYIYLINSVISYFFAGYRHSILLAHQRQDIESKITTVINFIVQTGQIIVLIMTKNFYAYAFVPIVGTLALNFLNAYVTRKRYPQIMCLGQLSEESRNDIRKKIKGLLGTKLNSIVIHSADTLIISAFLGLTMTAQYGNYYYVLNALCGLIAVLYSAMTASIGNKIATESKEECYALFNNLSFINGWLVGWISVCLFCLYEPLMKLWVGEDLSLGLPFSLFMTIYFFIYQIQKTVLTFKDAAGIWYADRLRPYVSMLVNVLCNLILVQFIGIYGIVVSTIIAFMISLPWINFVLFKELFQKKAISNLLRILVVFVATMITTVVTYSICHILPENFSGFVGRMLICFIVPNLIFLVLFFKTKEFRYFMALLGKVKRKFLK